MEPKVCFLPVGVALLVSGCGGASVPAKVDAMAWRACVEKKGYSLSTINPSTVAGNTSYGFLAPLLSAITTSPGYAPNSEVMASGSGSNVSVVGLFDDNADATNAETSMRAQLQSAGGENLMVERSRNLVWYGTTQASKDVSSCAAAG